jgi:hypothetical protein
MKSMVISAALATALATLASGAAFASDKCSVPKADWQPKEALQQKLEGEGWKVRNLKVEDGCYEVYGFNAEGKRMEVLFDPKSFSVVKAKS